MAKHAAMVIVVRCCRWGAHRAPNQCGSAQQERDTADCAGRREISEAIYGLTATPREHPGPPCFHAGCPTSDATNACNAITTCHRSAARVDAPTLPRHSRQPRKTRALRGCGCCEGWCREEESNLRPTHYECAALPTELFRQRIKDFTGRTAMAQARLWRRQGQATMKWWCRPRRRLLPGHGPASGSCILQVFQGKADNETTACAVRTWRA